MLKPFFADRKFLRIQIKEFESQFYNVSADRFVDLQ